MLRPNPNVIVFESGALGRWLNLEGGALVHEISTLSKETSESFPISSTMWSYREKTQPFTNQEMGSHQTPNLPVPWTWTS